MLPLPKLDNQTFDQIVENAKKLIPRIYPEWNDENYHDPGITFIELIAWLKEMQQYHLDQITPLSELKFLKLLGMKLQRKSCAKTQVRFWGAREQAYIPAGAKLIANDIFFETEKKLLLHAIDVKCVVVFAGGKYFNMYSDNSNYNMQFFAFGEEMSRGNAMYIGFSGVLPAGYDIPLYIEVFDEYPVQRNEIDEAFETPDTKQILWEYCSDLNGSEHWLPLVVLDDGTFDLRQSGRIVFRAEADMKKTALDGAKSDYYWIRATLLKPGCEESPKIKQLVLNTVQAVQKNTLSQCYVFSSSGKPEQSFRLDSYLSLFGNVEVQVGKDGIWKYWECVSSSELVGEKDVFSCDIDYVRGECVVSFGDGANGNIPEKGKSNIRIICCDKTFLERSIPGSGSGFPRQSFKTDIKNVFADDFMLQVGKIDINGDIMWEDWCLTDDIDASLPYQKHFSLDSENGDIIFGDNEHGMLPYIGQNNIRIISCSVGGGPGGNIRAGGITGIFSPAAHQGITFSGIGVENFVHAAGGCAGENLMDAKNRLKEELVSPHRAVTDEDFEEIAMKTPGLRVAKVKAIPAYRPGLKDYPAERSPNCVTVVAIPYSFNKKPVPDNDFLRRIKLYIDRYRLITTRIFTVSPEYIEINVSVSVAVNMHLGNARQMIGEQLRQFLRPLDVSGKAGGWEFGKPVYKKEIFSILDKLECVEYVDQLSLHARGNGFEKTSGGDIVIVPHGLIYMGECEINLI